MGFFKLKTNYWLLSGPELIPKWIFKTNNGKQITIPQNELPFTPLLLLSLYNNPPSPAVEPHDYHHCILQ